MNKNNTYPKWIGVLLGFLLSGSAHFLSGKRATGVKWYLALALISSLSLIILALPGVVSFYVAILTFILAVILWVIMLKQSYRPVRRIGFLGWMAVLALYFILGLGADALLNQVVRPFQVPTGGMSPALMPEDHIMVERISYHFKKPKRGDIIIFSTKNIDHISVRNDTYYIKRIVGLPGDTIQIDPPYLIVNGKKVTKDQLIRKEDNPLPEYTLEIGSLLSTPTDQIIVGENEYLTFGDNSKNSLDGRFYGTISKKSIIGRVRRIYWPLSRINK